MDEIRSWWEVPCVAHYCHIFQKAFKLPLVEIEELEDALLLDYSPNPSSLLVDLYCVLLNGIVDKDINTENWEFFLKLHFEWRCDHLAQKWNPFSGNKKYRDLNTRTKVEILHKLCHWRLELDDIADLLRGVDGPGLRLDPLGKDQEGNTYWHFFGMRLYKEAPKKKKKKEAADDTPSTKKGRGKATSKGARGRGTPNRRKAKEQTVENEEHHSEPEDQLEGQETSSTGWSVMFDTLDEWEAFTDSFMGIRLKDIRLLHSNLTDLLPHIEYLDQMREKEKKKKLIAAIPRRTSDRIAIKTAEKEEMEKLLAMEREMEREEMRKYEAEEQRLADEEAEKKRQQRREEAIQRRKAKEEQQAKQREAEEENWEKAMSGELTGRRKAAIVSAKSVSTVSAAFGETLLEDEKNELNTAMYKILGGLRNQEDSWVFEEPVTESIAPGYFDVIDTPMDFTTVEKRVEKNQYTDKEQFVKDVELIFKNCIEYNGEDSEYAELAQEMLKVLANLAKLHFEGGGVDPAEEEDVGEGRKKKRERSISPVLTSESSSEEESDDSDESFEEGNQKTKKRKAMPSVKPNMSLPPGFGDKLNALRPPQGHVPPQMNPHLYHQLMQQRMSMMTPDGRPMVGPNGRPMFPPRDPNFRIPPPYPGQRPPHYRPDMRMPYPGHFGEGRPMMGPDGKPMIGPDGRPMMGSARHMIGPDGRPMMDRYMPGADGRSMMDRYMPGPDGRPMMGPDGRPMMTPDARHMMDSRYMMGPDGRPIPYGRPMMGPDGRPYMAGPDGRPMTGPDGRPMMPGGRPMMGPDGKAPMMAPDGQPVTERAKLNPEGKPPNEAAGKPTDSEAMSTKEQPMLQDEKPSNQDEKEPEKAGQRDKKTTNEKSPDEPMETDDKPMNQDMKPSKEEKLNEKFVSENRTASTNKQVMMNPDHRAMIGANGRPMMGPDGGHMMGPNGKPLSMATDRRPMMGPDGRPMMTPDNQYNMMDNRYMMGPDGRHMMGPDGKPMMHPQMAAYYQQMMMHRHYQQQHHRYPPHAMPHRHHPNYPPPHHSASPGLQPSSPGLKQHSGSPGLKQQASSPTLKTQSSSPGLKQQISSPAPDKTATHEQIRSPSHVPRDTESPRVQLSDSPAPNTHSSPKHPSSMQTSPKVTQQPMPSPLRTNSVGNPQDKRKEVTPSTDEGRGSMSSPLCSNSTSSADPEHADLRQRQQAEQYERLRQQQMMAMQQRAPPYPGGTFGYPPTDRSADSMAAYYAWKNSMYHQEMDYMHQQQQRYWQEMEMRKNYEAMMRQRMAHEQKQGMMHRPPMDISHNGEKLEGLEAPPMDRPLSEKPHLYPTHPQMNGYAGMNQMMDHFPPHPHRPQGYGYKAPYAPCYPYPPQQGMSGPPSKPIVPQNGTSGQNNSASTEGTQS